MKAILIILALIILAALFYKRDAFWDMFPHGVTEPALQDTTVR